MKEDVLAGLLTDTEAWMIPSGQDRGEPLPCPDTP